jgi:DNA-binding GntR family transcriptional regulator
VWSSHELLQKSDREHYEMMAALKARDAGQLAILIAAHIIKGAPVGPAPI